MGLLALGLLIINYVWPKTIIIKHHPSRLSYNQPIIVLSSQSKLNADTQRKRDTEILMYKLLDGPLICRCLKKRKEVIVWLGHEVDVSDGFHELIILSLCPL